MATGSKAPRNGYWIFVLLAALISISLPLAPVAANPGLIVTDLADPDLTPGDLAASLAGPGVAVSNASYTGADGASGTFSGGTGIIGFESGILLTSGSAQNVIGPNVSDGITTINGTNGDPDLSDLVGAETNDAAVLEFDVTADGSMVEFRYVFASDEYNEFVGSGFDDVFGFFVGGTNCATVGEQRVSIDTINLESNPELYRNNDPSDFPEGATPIDTEMDGLTVVLTCLAEIAPNEPTHVKLAIADTGDASLDSAVFLESGSFTPADNSPPVAEDDSAATHPGEPVTIDVLANDSDPDEDQLSVQIVGQPGHGTAMVNEDQTVTYAPGEGFSGDVDTFTYQASDGMALSNEATVTVGVFEADVVFEDLPPGGEISTTSPDGLTVFVIESEGGGLTFLGAVSNENVTFCSTTPRCIGEYQAQFYISSPSTLVFEWNPSLFQLNGAPSRGKPGPPPEVDFFKELPDGTITAPLPECAKRGPRETPCELMVKVLGNGTIQGQVLSEPGDPIKGGFR